MTMTRFMVLTKYDEGLEAPPMAEWDPDDITALLEYLRALNQELIENGELVEGTILAGPELARIVVSDGGPPVVTDGPFPEAKEQIGGFWIIEAESVDEAVEWARQVPMTNGSIEVRSLVPEDVGQQA